jgi:transposase InsO family protein
MGNQKTDSKIKMEFYWPGMKTDIRTFIRECDICQRNQGENIHPAGLLQPLPIPTQVWTDVSMDFIDGLPTSHEKDVILVVIDRLSKYAHFLPLSHPYTASTVAQIFLDQIFKLHGLPKSIVSDRDKVFTSNFWRDLFRLSGTDLLLSSTYHPQTDGQTEVMNRSLEGYLRSVVGDRDWLRWLSLAEWAYNTSVHTSTKLTPFEAVYGYPPPRLLPYEPGTTSVQAVEDTLKTREFILSLIRENLQDAQARMKLFADRLRTFREFDIGDWVYLRLRPYRQMLVSVRRNLKLSPRYYGPFLIVQKIGTVAYRLDLPPTSQIYPVFHVSLLKKQLGARTNPLVTLPILTPEGTLTPEPEKVLNRRLMRKGNRAGAEVLIQ